MGAGRDVVLERERAESRDAVGDGRRGSRGGARRRCGLATLRPLPQVWYVLGAVIGLGTELEAAALGAAEGSHGRTGQRSRPGRQATRG